MNTNMHIIPEFLVFSELKDFWRELEDDIGGEGNDTGGADNDTGGADNDTGGEENGIEHGRLSSSGSPTEDNSEISSELLSSDPR
jgi:hypothetical protein